MAEPAKLPVKTEKTAAASAPSPWRPFEQLRREVDRLFDDFNGGFWRPSFSRSLFDVAPFGRGEPSLPTIPAVDVSETDKGYEIKAELPGMEEKNIEVKLADGVLTIKGEKQEQKEDKQKDYYVQERSFGSFQRSFQLPDNVDTNKIEAHFKNGVLTLALPKTAEAQKPAKKIEVKAA
jgi:HSP20 family protein